jgi:hypothetical protein
MEARHGLNNEEAVKENEITTSTTAAAHAGKADSGGFL